MSDDTIRSECDSDESFEQLLAAVGKRFKALAEETEHVLPSRLYVIAHDASSASAAESDHFEKCEICRSARDRYSTMLVSKQHNTLSDDTNDQCLEEPEVIKQIPTAALRRAFQSDTGEWLALSSAVLADFQQRRSSIDCLDEITYLEERISRDDSDATTLARAIREMMGPTKSNPILEVAIGWAIKQAFSAGRRATSRLYDRLGEIIEATKASSGSIWLVDSRANGKRFVVPLITYNQSQSDAKEYEIVTGGKGVIATVAATAVAGHRKYLHDINKWPDLYIKTLGETVSELALPLMLGPISGNGSVDDNHDRFVAVLDLQFREVPCDSQSHAQREFCDRVERMAAKMRPDLEVIETLRNVNCNWCCFHPVIHTSCFREPLEELCNSISSLIGWNNSTMTIWSADWKHRTLHAYATKGYDYAFLGELELPIDDSETGWGLMRAIRGIDLHTVSDPQSMFSMNDQARLQGLRHAFIAPFSGIPCPERHEDLLGCINVYFFGESTSHLDCWYKDVEEALPQLARFVGRLCESYKTARLRYFSERCHVALEHPIEGKVSATASLYAYKELMKEAFSGTVSTSRNAASLSIWGCSQDFLYCIDSDALCRLRPPDESDTRSLAFAPGQIPPFKGDPWGPIYYDLSKQSHAGFTTYLASEQRSEKSGGLIPRILRAKVRGAQGSEGVAIPPSGRFSEYFGTEMEFDRWFLGISVLDQQRKNVIGVIRVVRPLEGRPFTESDEELLRTFAHGASHIFEQWRRELGTYFERVGMRRTEQDSRQKSQPSASSSVHGTKESRMLHGPIVSAAAESGERIERDTKHAPTFEDADYCLVRVIVNDRNTGEIICSRLTHTSRGQCGVHGKTVRRLQVPINNLLSDWSLGDSRDYEIEYERANDTTLDLFALDEIAEYLQSVAGKVPEVILVQIQRLQCILAKRKTPSEAT